GSGCLALALATPQGSAFEGAHCSAVDKGSRHFKSSCGVKQCSACTRQARTFQRQAASPILGGSNLRLWKNEEASGIVPDLAHQANLFPRSPFRQVLIPRSPMR